MATAPAGDHLSNHVHQASGMVAAQIDCDIEQALQLMIIRAASTRVSLDDLALDVLDRRVTFSA